MKRSWLLAMVAFVSCGLRPSASEDKNSIYDLETPANVVILPSNLGEISGLAWVAENELATVQDESLAVFMVDPSTGVAREDYNSGISADIEGITVKDGEFWVVESSGYVYRLGRDSLEVFPTRFNRKNNLEGIFWDSTGHRFLLTCKGHPGIPQAGDTRAIYAFDSLLHPLSDLPYMQIDAAEIAQRPEARNALEIVDIQQSKKKGKKSSEQKYKQVFQPSDLAVHPIFNTIFVLSAASGLLAEYSQSGELLDLWRLPGKHLPKAEGIAFAPDGTLFIASERGCPTCRPSLAIFHLKQTHRPQ